MEDTEQREDRFRLLPMRPRDPGKSGRTASMLELFFDLVFVVAVGTASTSLSGTLGEGHVVDGVLHFALVFFGIWWAWMNSTWFATSFEQSGSPALSCCGFSPSSCRTGLSDGSCRFWSSSTRSSPSRS